MSRWSDGIRAHFLERPELPASELYALFLLPAEISQAEFEKAVRVFRMEYDIVAGTLRPDDSLDIFVKQPETHGPIDWFLTQPVYEDRLSELNYHLGQERWRTRAPRLKSWASTIREYVLAWAGNSLD